MILKETLKEVVKAQKAELLQTPLGISRKKSEEIATDIGLAVVVSGIRRSGKSTVLRQIINQQKTFHYLNFEDVRIFGFNVEDFKRLEAVFDEECISDYYFFDEIQNIPNWEIFVRTLIDRKKTKIFITGSNASMLSRELGTRLTGRHIRYELFPFSYMEYLKFRNMKPGISSFEKYFEEGGFPEYLMYKNIRVPQELFNDIITRDIIVRHSLRNEKVVKDIALYLISNVAKEFSFTQLAKLHGMGSTNTIISLINYFENSYLFYSVPRFDFSLKKQIRNPKKIYSVDTGFVRANSVSFSRDEGRLLENLVFQELRRRDNSIYYFRQERECDFVVRDRKNKYHAFQVCLDLNEENKSREINGLLEAMQYLKISSGLILTLKQEDALQIDGKTITVLPVWKWLME